MPTLCDPGQPQQFDWGSIRWIAEPGSGGVEHVSAGFLTFAPRALQHEHTHTGYEQIVYIISGHGAHSVNGVESALSPGMLVHIPPFAVHSVRNETDEALTLVSLYFPLRLRNVSGHECPEPALRPEGDLWAHLDMAALGDLIDKLSRALGFRLVLIDTEGKSFIKSPNAPAFCAMVHEASKGNHCRRRVREVLRDFGGDERGKLFVCCNSIVGMMVPVVVNRQTVGYIKCGEIFLSKPDQGLMTDALRGTAKRYGLAPEELARAALDVRVELKSVLYAAAEATLAIASYITEMAASARRRRELDNSRLSLAREQMASARLEKALREADFKLLQSRINPHFLFNTLSAVAQTAYLEGAEKAADLTWSLSDLLRATLRKTDAMVSFAEECLLLGDYLKIQQARFGDRLSIVWDIEKGLDDARIPCMLLQPLVENAVIHGLEPALKPGAVTIAARSEHGALICSVSDNGVGFPPAAVEEKTDRIGIASVRNRLGYYFADAAGLDITSTPGKGTSVVVRLPLSRAETVGGDADA